jgi:hypothetical protein
VTTSISDLRFTLKDLIQVVVFSVSLVVGYMGMSSKFDTAIQDVKANAITKEEFTIALERIEEKQDKIIESLNKSYTMLYTVQQDIAVLKARMDE